MQLTRLAMSLPRPVIAGSTVMLTRRCTQRQFLLLPSPIVNQILLWCLAVAATRFGIEVHAVCFMSNHWHAVITDTLGQRPEFCRWFHEFSAKCINATLGRWENVWASEQPSVVDCVDEAAQLKQSCYTMGNPVEAGLVRRGEQWPGVRLGPQDIGGEITVERPKIFFREDGPTPKTATLRITKLPALAHLSDEAYIKQMTALIEAHEAKMAAKVVAEGRTFLGVRDVRKQSPFDSPRSHEPRRKMSPRVASRNKWARIEALQRLEEFLADYRKAWKPYREGRSPPVRFPPGTYWLRVYVGVPCAAPT
jgi:REP element-mobilizing transposase RayT